VNGVTFFCAERQYFRLASVKWGTTEGGQESFRNLSSPRSSGNCLGLCFNNQIALRFYAAHS